MMGKFGRNRTRNKRLANKIIYILCEGQKTEPLYFDGFKKSLEQKIRRKNVAIVIKGAGRNTLSLVEYAIKNPPPGYEQKLDEKWVVFDEDTKERGDFDNAIKKAEANNWQVAYSNECFELWYLLHFSYYNVDNGRDEYFRKLIAELRLCSPPINLTNWRTQGKSISGIYDILSSRQSTAINNAKKLLASHAKKAPSKQRPSSTVHLLVESLNKLNKKEAKRKSRWKSKKRVN